MLPPLLDLQETLNLTPTMDQPPHAKPLWHLLLGEGKDRTMMTTMAVNHTETGHVTTSEDEEDSEDEVDHVDQADRMDRADRQAHMGPTDHTETEISRSDQRQERLNSHTQNPSMANQ
jgi:hypothetical protein